MKKNSVNPRAILVALAGAIGIGVGALARLPLFSIVGGLMIVAAGVIRRRPWTK